MTLEFNFWNGVAFFVLAILPIIMLWANSTESDKKDTRYHNLSQKERDDLANKITETSTRSET